MSVCVGKIRKSERSKVAHVSVVVMSLSLLFISYCWAYTFTENLLVGLHQPNHVSADGRLVAATSRAERLLSWSILGTTRSGITELAFRPAGVTVWGRYLLVYYADTTLVESFDLVMGMASRRVSLTGKLQGLAVGSDSPALWGLRGNEIVPFNADLVESPGLVLTRLRLSLHPSDVAWDPAQSLLLVGNPGNGEVARYASDGTFHDALGTLGSDPGMLARVQGVAFHFGLTAVADDFLDRISLFDSAGTFLERFGAYGPDPGQFLSVQGLTFLANGDLLTADPAAGRISRFTASGVPLPNTNPFQFRLIRPLDDSLDVATGFVWESSQDVDSGDVVSYALQISSSLDFTSPREIPAVDTIYADSITLRHGRTYYWRVLAQDGHGGQRVSQNTGRFYLRGTGVDLAEASTGSTTAEIVPNPFRTTPEVRWRLPGLRGTALLTAFDVIGSPVGSLNATVTNGRADWSPEALKSLNLAPGVYTFELHCGAAQTTLRAIRVP